MYPTLCPDWLRGNIGPNSKNTGCTLCGAGKSCKHGLHQVPKDSNFTDIKAAYKERYPGQFTEQAYAEAKKRKQDEQQQKKCEYRTNTTSQLRPNQWRLWLGYEGRTIRTKISIPKTGAKSSNRFLRAQPDVQKKPYPTAASKLRKEKG